MKNNLLLEKIFEKKDLSPVEIEFLLDSCIGGELTDAQLAAMLIGLRMKGETTDEISGLIRGMRKHSINFSVASEAIDTCGTGGDGRGTFNISTVVSFVVAGAGVPVIKHGNKAASSKCGSADVLSALGVDIMLSPEQSKKVFESVGMIFLFAPIYHPAMKHIAPIRKSLGTRTVFNFLGPFLNPAQVKRQLIGVPSVALAERLAIVATKFDYEYLLLVASDSGLDEIGLDGQTQIFEVKGKKVTRNRINPQALGFKRYPLGDIKGEDMQRNASIIKEILSGEKGAKRDIVVLNSAYALLVFGRVSDVAEGIKLAETSIDSGAAKAVLYNLIKETKKYAK
jgi:anthranilate phosphoribosyltransferase